VTNLPFSHQENAEVGVMAFLLQVVILTERARPVGACCGKSRGGVHCCIGIGRQALFNASTNEGILFFHAPDHHVYTIAG